MNSEAAVSLMSCIIQFTIDNNIANASDIENAAIVTGFRNLENYLELHMYEEYTEACTKFNTLFSFLKEQGQEVVYKKMKANWSYSIIPGSKYEEKEERNPKLFPPLNRRLFYNYNLFVLYKKFQNPKYYGTKEEFSVITENLTKEIRVCFKVKSLNEEDYAYRKEIADYISTEMEEFFNDKDITVVTIGSVHTKLALLDSDINMGIRISPKRIKEGEFLCNPDNWEGTLYDTYYLAECLRKIGMEATLPIPLANRTKCTEPTSGFKFAIGIDNGLILERDNLIIEYLKLDKRIRPLIIAILQFTRFQKINRSIREQTLSTYSYVIMTLHFLMNALEKPVIPSLQKLFGECNSPDCFYNLYDGPVSTFFDNKFEKADVQYHTCVLVINKQTGAIRNADDNDTKSTIWFSENDDDLGTLLLGFFDYYSRRDNYREVSIISGTGKLFGLTREEQRADVVWVQDPFLIKKNIARSCKYFSLKKIADVFAAAADMLKEGEAFQDICDE